MLYVKGANNIEPNARLENFNIILEITQKCGYKARVISQPASKTTTEATEATETPVSAARRDSVASLLNSRSIRF